MWRSVVFKAIVGAYIAWGAWNWYRDRPIHPSDGILAPGEPLQVDSNAQPSRRIGRWTLTPRASYRITARILHTQRYHFDFLATLIPEDLALGWGPMSDNRILDTMNISQSNRFYYWRSPQHAALAKE